MIQPTAHFLNPSERSSLEALQRASKDKRTCDRLRAILLLDNGWSYKKVATALFIDIESVRRYYRTYSEGGKEALLILNYSGKTSLLNENQLNEVKEYVKKTVPSTAKEVMAYIEKKFSITYSESAVVMLLHKLGFAYKKPKLVPGKADPKKQELFLNELEELEASLEDGDKVLYMDGVHPQHNSKPAFGWMEKGQDIILKSNTGRQRININGAIDVDAMDVAVDVTDSVNAQSTIRLFGELEKKYPDAKRIVIICDNAKYYRSQLVNSYLETSRVEIKFLPPYSPNLNLIERLWRFMNKKTRNNIYYEKFKDFKNSVLGFFENFKEYEVELRALLIKKFRIIKPQFES